jgi:hypothetical protein
MFWNTNRASPRNGARRREKRLRLKDRLKQFIHLPVSIREFVEVHANFIQYIVK